MRVTGLPFADDAPKPCGPSSAGKLDAIALRVDVKAGKSPARKSPFPPFRTAIECEPAQAVRREALSPPLREAVPS